MTVEQLEVLRRVGRYEIIREIGRGATAVVYVARQTDLDRLVALKELSAVHARDPAFVERFLRESRLAASLNHPNVVTVHEYFEHEGVAYIAMEYLERGSLRPLVGHVTLPQVAGVLEGLLAGLAHAESKGVVHRDLKPENVMVTSSGGVKIADFGVAKVLQRDGSAALTLTGTTVGTPAYMAPEQAVSAPVGPATDLYAVGVIAYELLTGDVPYHADVALALLLRHVHDPVPSPRAVEPDLDPRLSDWVERMLAKKPEDRPCGAATAWDELEEIVVDLLGSRWGRRSRLDQSGSLPVAADRGTGPTEPLEPSPRRRLHVRRRLLAAVGGAAALAAAAAGVAVADALSEGDGEAATTEIERPRQVTATSPPLEREHATVGGIRFTRDGRDLMATIRSAERALPPATVRRRDSDISDGRAWFELRGTGITASTRGASNGELRLRVRRGRNRVRVDVVAEAGAFSGFAVRRVDGRTVVVTVTAPEPVVSPPTSKPPVSQRPTTTTGPEEAPPTTTTEPEQTTPKTSKDPYQTG